MIEVFWNKWLNSFSIASISTRYFDIRNQIKVLNFTIAEQFLFYFCFISVFLTSNRSDISWNRVDFEMYFLLIAKIFDQICFNSRNLRCGSKDNLHPTLPPLYLSSSTPIPSAARRACHIAIRSRLEILFCEGNCEEYIDCLHHKFAHNQAHSCHFRWAQFYTAFQAEIEWLWKCWNDTVENCVWNIESKSISTSFPLQNETIWDRWLSSISSFHSFYFHSKDISKQIDVCQCSTLILIWVWDTKRLETSKLNHNIRIHIAYFSSIE